MTAPGVPNGLRGFTPNPAYAVPSEGGNPPEWHDSPINAWAPKADGTIGSTPDPMRIGRTKTADYRPNAADPPEDFWLGAHGPGRERMLRHGVEFQDADGLAADIPQLKPQAPNPRSVPTPEPRPTNRMMPKSYVFTRPFDQHAARQNNGLHFSMADHRRAYPILGMEPVRRRRNTFRAEPAPWDSDLVDMPNDAANNPYRPGPIVAFDVPSTRNFRLT